MRQYSASRFGMTARGRGLDKLYGHRPVPVTGAGEPCELSCPRREQPPRARFSEATSGTPSQRIWSAAGPRRAAGPSPMRRNKFVERLLTTNLTSPTRRSGTQSMLRVPLPRIGPRRGRQLTRPGSGRRGLGQNGQHRSRHSSQLPAPWPNLPPRVSGNPPATWRPPTLCTAGGGPPPLLTALQRYGVPPQTCRSA